MTEDKALLALMKDQVEAWLVEDDASDWWKWQHQYALAADRIEALTAENERLREALKPSSDTKAAFIGEFSFPVEEMDEEGNEYTRKQYVPWTTIKEIMAAIRKRALGDTQ